MHRKLIQFALGLLLLYACTPVNTVEISARCERDDIGNYIIKWETSPIIEGVVRVFVSNSPEEFDYTRPVGYANISEGVTTYVTNDNITRKYFRLIFADKYTKTVAARSVNMDRLQNFRDIGGYKAIGNKTIKWGMVYRSGAFTRTNDWDSIRLRRLHLKTLIDLRSPSEKSLYPTAYALPKVVNIPFVSENLHDVFPRIRDEKMKKEDVRLMLQGRYLDFVHYYDKELGQALSLFMDERNYPFVISSSFGKDRAGLLCALLLNILGVPEGQIMQDYLLSNDCLDKKSFAYLVKNSNVDVQEALTTFLSVDEQLYHLYFRQSKKEYGSVSNFLTEKLGITKEGQEQIKAILLE